MRIVFEDPRLEKLLANKAKAYRKYGHKAIDTLYARLSDIESVASASELVMLPGDFHPLKHNMSGLWACSLTGALRLIMRVEDDMTAIIEITDYHKRK